MALPEQLQKQVDLTLSAYCNRKVPAEIRNQVRLVYSVTGNTVTLYEERPTQTQLEKRVKRPLAQFRWNSTDQLWRLYCTKLRGLEGWLPYPHSKPTKTIDELVLALDQDQSGVFWG